MGFVASSEGSIGCRLRRLSLAVVLSLATLAALASAAAQAAVFTADPSIADTSTASDCSSPCALRQAVADALASSDPSSTIYLESGTYELTLGTLQIDPSARASITLEGEASAATDTVLHGDGGARVLQIGNGGGSIGSVTLSTLEITGGDAAGAQGGGAYVDPGAVLYVESSEITGNTAGTSGGGIDDNGTLYVQSSLIDHNTASTIGGGIDDFSEDGGVQVSDSTIADNTVGTGQGGGFYDGAADTTIAGSTIAGNSAGSSDGGGLAGSDTPALIGSIVADNTGNDCSADQGFAGASADNVIDDGSCDGLANGVDGNQTGTDPELANAPAPTLESNGGSTETISLDSGSPAIGAVPAGSCDSYDQRGAVRLTVVATACDAGAFETGTDSPIVTTGSAASVDSATQTVTGTVSGDGAGAAYFFQYTPDSDFASSNDSYEDQTAIYADQTAGGPPVDVAAELTGLSSSTLYDYRIAATNDFGISFGANEQFTTAAASGGGGGGGGGPTTPSATTGGTDGLTDQSVTVLGTVDPDGQSCQYEFEWGTTPSYGSSTTPASAGSSAVFSAGAYLSGLIGGTTYHYRIEAICDVTTYDGADMSFTTLGPTAASGAASSITTTSALVAYTINPRGSQTAFHVDYGTTTAYGSQLPSPDAPIGADSVPHTGNTTLRGLTPGTLYHYRVEATNATGTSYGADETFTTLPPPATIYGDSAQGITTSSAEITGSAGLNGVSSGQVRVDYVADADYNAGATDPYGGSHTSESSLPPAGIITVPISGLIPNTTYDYRVEVTDSSGTTTGTNQTFTTLPAGPPQTSSLPATGTTPVSATLNGAVNDENYPGSYFFQYTVSVVSCSGKTISVSGSTAPTSLAGGFSAKAVSAAIDLNTLADLADLYAPTTLSGELGEALSGSTGYNQNLGPFPGIGLSGIQVSYQLVFSPSSSSAGGNVDSATSTADLPALNTSSSGTATSISPTTEELSSDVIPSLSDPDQEYSEEAEFDYGASTGYGASTTPAPLSGSCPVVLTAEVASLAPDTTYHFRVAQLPAQVICAGGEGGGGLSPTGTVTNTCEDPTLVVVPSSILTPPPVYGPDETFTTAATSPPTGTSVSTTSGTGSTTIPCGPDSSPCTGSYELIGELSAGKLPGARSAAVSTRATPKVTTVVLAVVDFTIPPGQSRTIHFHLTSAGKRFLKAHPHATVIAQVTSHAGRGPKVTTRTVVHLKMAAARTKRHRERKQG